MKKNNKGFTLVELLAAIVILGLLVAMTMPTILNLLSNNKDKIYISDAKKLIARAEYKIRASSSTIEKPDSDSNDCIVISLVYLNNSDFDVPPNKGKYIQEASFVVIRYKDNKLEYSATLVEEMKKGGYRGVELSLDKNLNANSTRHVVDFKKEDIKFVENNDVAKKYGSSNIVSDAYINSKLGTGYVGNISKIYNFPDLADSTSNGKYAIPKITSASVTSAINKDYNTLESKLKLVVSDADTALSQLKVYIGFNDYPDYTKVFTQHTGANNIDTFDKFRDTMFAYGSNSYFSLNINFAAYNKTYNGEVVNIYIVVVDPQGNFDNRVIRYKLYSNLGPTISGNSNVTRRPQDNYNLNTAVVYAPITDDIDSQDKIYVCVTDQSTNYSYCDQNGLWSKYTEKFGADNKLNFTFACPSSGCVYDGSVKQLGIFAKDSYGTVTTKVLEYQFFANTPPTVNKLDIVSNNVSFVGSKNALDAKVKFNLTDEDVNSVTIRISDDESFSKNVVSGSYSEFSSGLGKSFSFSGNYDGVDRVLHYELTDCYGAVRTGSTIYNNIYKNSKPVINSSSVTSKAISTYVCPNTSRCSIDNGGAYETTVTLDASDDLTENSNLSVCVSEVKSDCESYNASKFVAYSSSLNYTFTVPSSGKFDTANNNKKLYLSVYDGYYDVAEVSNVSEISYKIYHNQAPVLRDFVIKSKHDYNSTDVIFNFNASDDIDINNNLTYQLIEKKDGTKVNEVTGNLSDLTINDSGDYLIEYSINGTYDGSSRTFNLKILDTSNVSSIVGNIVYNLHRNEAPKISNVVVTSADDFCKDSSLCSANGSYNVTVTFNANDDITPTNNILYDIVNGNDCSSATYKTASPGTFGTSSFTIAGSTAAKKFDGSSKDITVCLKDEAGATSSKTVQYEVYKNKPAYVVDDFLKIESYVYPVNGLTYNLQNFKFNIDLYDDLVEKTEFSSKFNMKVCYKKSGSEAETCIKDANDNDLFAYTNSVDVDLGNVALDGSLYYVYAYIYDDYDAETVSSSVPYRLFTDEGPNIQSFTIESSDSEHPEDLSTLNVAFEVHDLFSTYTYCLSESETECSTYSTPQRGYCESGTTCSLPVSTTYNTNWSSTPSLNHKVYLHVKNLYDMTNVVYAEVSPDICSDEIDPKSQVDYVFENTTLDITADRCSNRCYYWPSYVGEYNDSVPPDLRTASDTASISAKYKVIQNLFDANYNVFCRKDEYEHIDMHCDFYKCFKNPNEDNYNISAIGKKLVTDSASWTHVHPDGSSHTVTSHYNLYTSSYNNNTGKIELAFNDTEKICPQCLTKITDTEEYQYPSISYFVRVNDYGRED